MTRVVSHLHETFPYDGTRHIAMRSDTEFFAQLRALGEDIGGMIVPPATPEQLIYSEQMLGFPLPTSLTKYYLHVANGGFGPPYGVIGVQDGYYGPMSAVGIHLCDGNLGEAQIDDAIAPLALGETIQCRVPYGESRSHSFLPLIGEGCAIYTEMHVATERIYRSEPIDDDRVAVTYLAPSFDVYLWQWYNQLDRSDYSRWYRMMKRDFTSQTTSS